MIKFKLLKQSKKSKARLGLLETLHGIVETPALVTVATQAAVKTLTTKEVIAAKSQLLICNTFHLHLKPGEKIVKSAGGLHQFMNWPKPLMTDSGGFQVFSLGFGRDLGVGKVLKYFPGEQDKDLVTKSTQPKSIKITPEGVYFQSPLDGSKLFLGPKESIKIQESLGADIIFAFDECTPPLSSQEYVEKSLERTHNWAKICLQTKKTDQAIYGIVQGSKYRVLREKAAKFINSLDFNGFGIGGDLGHNRAHMIEILNWTLPHLNLTKPRHLLGIGYLEDMEPVIKSGIDTFDCIVPTHYARHGIAFTSCGKINLRQSRYLKDKKPLDPKCKCETCQTYKRNYLSHLFRAEEISAMSLVTKHNLFYFNSYVESLREKIKNNQI